MSLDVNDLLGMGDPREPAALGSARSSVPVGALPRKLAARCAEQPSGSAPSCTGTGCRTVPRKSGSRSASIAVNTGSSSPGELEIAPSTSEVAVCCSKPPTTHGCAPAPHRTAGRSRSRSPPGRAKVVTSSICLSVKGRTCLRYRMITPIGVPSGIGTTRIVRST